MLKAKYDAQKALVATAVTAGRGMTEEEQKSYDDLDIEIKNLEKTIEAQKAVEARDAASKEPATTPIYATPKGSDKEEKLFKNLAEQLKAVKNAAVNNVVDERLAKLNKKNEIKNAALGANEGAPEDGGYVVQEDFASGMMESAATAGQILPKVDRYEISSNANRVEWNEIDESSVATTVFGGIQVYWAAEAAAVTASKPALKEMEMKLHKLMGIAYSTYELDADSNFTSQLYTKAFTLAIQRELESCIIAGNGAGKPLGILKGGSLVTVAKETAQTADTIIWENIVKMYNRVLNKQANLAWIMHPDCAEQLDFLNFPIGVGGVPVYLGASSVGSIASLKGVPIIESDHCSALGDKGDIFLVDLSQYMLITKGGVQTDSSMHVQFLTAENAFRFIFRANGQPKKNATLTIKNSSNTRSSFVTLAERT